MYFQVMVSFVQKDLEKPKPKNIKVRSLILQNSWHDLFSNLPTVRWSHSDQRSQNATFSFLLIYSCSLCMPLFLGSHCLDNQQEILPTTGQYVKKKTVRLQKEVVSTQNSLSVKKRCSPYAQ